MNEEMTFGECLTELLRKKHISTADLTRRMNYRSKTSLTRLLRDEVRYASIEDFMSRLEPVSAWLMTDEEMQRLRDAMEVSRLGRPRYRMYREMWQLVGEGDSARGEVLAESFGAARARTLHEAAQVWAEAERVELVILNSGCNGLFSEIEELLHHRPDADVSIRHYLTVQESPGDVAGQLSALMAVFHHPSYQGFYRNCKGSVPETGERIESQVAAVRAQMKNGDTVFQIITMQSGNRCLIYEAARDDGMIAFFRRMVETTCEGALPLKVQYPEQELLEGLIVICQRYLSCEQDRATFCLAPNVCFELIPFEILYRVMFDSVLEGYLPDDQKILRLSEVHKVRYSNVHAKKKPTVFVFSWSGLQEFARTGRTTDHVAGMRCFTPEERAAILRDLAEKCRENVYLGVYILKPEVRVRGMTLTSYSGLGVYLLDAYTQYDVVNGHSEAFILMPGFAAALEEFFRDELIGKCTYSAAESIEMLTSLAGTLDEGGAV